MKNSWQVVVVLAAALLLAVAPAAADEDPGVDCDEARAGEQMTCTATGLPADSEAQWTATFDDGDDESDQGEDVTADGEGVASFDVDVPDAPGVDYEVEVTGDDDYEQSTTGEVVAADDNGNGEGDGTAAAGTTSLSCGEAVAGLTLSCEAIGLQADSEAQWATFFDEALDTAEQGLAIADANGVATFDVELPDQPDAPYGVRVTGTAADGGPYEETTEGLIVAASADTDDPTVEDATQDDDGGDGAAGDDDEQVSPTPKGGADAGYGGTAASSGLPGASTLLAGLALLGAAAVLLTRYTTMPARVSRRLRERRAQG